jgi:RNA polymerase sigma-70 factor (ECF subfamily)
MVVHFPCADRLATSEADELRRAWQGLSLKLRFAKERRRAMGAVQQDEVAARSLLGRARSGDADAFAEVFALHRGAILRLCRRMLDDAASAEDAVSEVFLRARRSLDSYDPERPFAPWLRRLASNHCIDQLRIRRTERGLFSAVDFADVELADDAPDALQRISGREKRRDVVDALDALPATYRLPLVLRFYQELDYDAIAEILGVTRNQVGTLLFRAKKRLRAELLARGTR